MRGSSAIEVIESSWVRCRMPSLSRSARLPGWTSDSQGKRCIVTGGSDGIGAATARMLAAEGAAVGIVARRREMLDAVAAECRAAGAPVAVVAVADLRDAAAQAAAFDALIAALGGVDVLVNNAGDSKLGTIESLDDAAWQESFDLKLMGYVRGMRHVLPAMRGPAVGLHRQHPRHGRHQPVVGATCCRASSPRSPSSPRRSPTRSRPTACGSSGSAPATRRPSG